MIYVINGMSGSGKSTFCSFVKDIAGADYSVEFSTVDKVKEIAKMCGWDGKEKTPAARELMYDIKVATHKFNDMPFQSVVSYITDFYKNAAAKGISEEKIAIFVNSRDPIEIQRFKAELGAKTILVKNRTIEQKGIIGEYDKEIYNYAYDTIIYNNGSKYDLVKLAEDFVKAEGIHLENLPQIDLFGEIYYNNIIEF